MWKTLRGQITVKPPKRGAMKQAKAAALDQFEADFGVKLPASYRAFVEEFGPGEIGGYFRICAPGYNGKSLDLAGLVKLVRENSDVYADQYGDEKLVAGMIPFADTIGGDVIVWNPKKAGGKDTDEYPILLLASGRDKPIKLAATFPEFVTDVCLSDSFGKVIKDPNYRADREFIPYTKPT